MLHAPTRPQLNGDFGMVSSSHWISSSVAMRILEMGGNAFDAAAAGMFALQVIEPHQNGPGGDLVALLYNAGDMAPKVLCGQGTAPAAAIPAAFSTLGLDLIPGSGLLPATVPGATPSILLMLLHHGSLSLRMVLEPTIALAQKGYVLGEKASITIAALASVFSEYWPSSYNVYTPNGKVPQSGKRFANPMLATMYTRLLNEAEAQGGASRDRQIEQALHTWHHGFIAETIDNFSKCLHRDANGFEHYGLLTGDDLATWSPSIEDALSVDMGDYRVFKAGPWTQGPVLLQQLNLLADYEINLESAESVHIVAEAAKLAFADREAWYGDEANVPIEALISSDYAAQRRKLIGSEASQEFRPGTPAGHSPKLPNLSQFKSVNFENPAFAEPNFSHPSPKPGASSGDTVHIDVVDREGNMVSAMPSGGWLHSSPIIPELGFSLGTRMQMMWLEQGLPSSLAPGKRPRTTLSPSMVFKEDQPLMAFGSPGGDQQDQWQIAFLLSVLHGERNMQRAIEKPKFHIRHFPASFFPRKQVLGELVIEEHIGSSTIAELKRRGHEVITAAPGMVGKVFAVRQDPETGFLQAAADPRGGLGYAVGR